MAGPHLRAEVLGAFAYGQVRSNQCKRDPLSDDGDFCFTWLQARGSFMRPSLQAQAAAHFGRWTGGGGARIALVRFQYDEVVGHVGHVNASIPTFEPFIVQRVELPFGSLQLTIHVPIVAYSPSVKLDQMSAEYNVTSTKLIETPSPRIFLGFQANLDELWRTRP